MSVNYSRDASLFNSFPWPSPLLSFLLGGAHNLSCINMINIVGGPGPFLRFLCQKVKIKKMGWVCRFRISVGRRTEAEVRCWLCLLCSLIGNIWQIKHKKTNEIKKRIRISHNPMSVVSITENHNVPKERMDLPLDFREHGVSVCGRAGEAGPALRRKARSLKLPRETPGARRAPEAGTPPPRCRCRRVRISCLGC